MAAAQSVFLDGNFMSKMTYPRSYALQLGLFLTLSEEVFASVYASMQLCRHLKRRAVQITTVYSCA